jgi:cytochrome oxidase Cu insertion factor (SCO1/SenC/PrrC family)
MRPRFPLLVALAALVLILGACGGDPRPDRGAAASTTAAPGPDTTAVAEPTTQTTWPLPKGVVPAGQREPAPDLQVTDFDGRTVTLGGFRGQPVVVNFFESW